MAPLVYANALAVDSSIRTVITAIQLADTRTRQEGHSPQRSPRIVEISDSDEDDDEPVRPTPSRIIEISDSEEDDDGQIRPTSIAPTLPANPAPRVQPPTVHPHTVIIDDSDSDKGCRYPTHATFYSPQDQINRGKALRRLAKNALKKERQFSNTSHSDDEFEELLADLSLSGDSGEPSIKSFVIYFSNTAQRSLNRRVQRFRHQALLRLRHQARLRLGHRAVLRPAVTHPRHSLKDLRPRLRSYIMYIQKLGRA